MLCERTYVVLGMHRSSTSIVAQGMESVLGPGSMGETNGYFEDPEFLELNDVILKRAGGSWHSPPDEPSIVALRNDPEIKERVLALITTRNEKFRFWGWKDPRTVLTLGCYYHWLIKPHFVCCFRSAEDIALSFIRRGDGLTYREGLNLARCYHSRMLKLLSEIYQ